MARTALHFFPTFAVGGAQRRFAQIAVGVPGWRHVIVALDGDRAADAILGDADRRYEALSLAPSSGISIANIRAIRRLIAATAPDLVCSYNWGAIEAVAANRSGPGIPHLHFEDGFGPEEAEGQLRRRQLARTLLLGAGGPHVAVPSRGLARMANGWGVPDRRLHRIANGVDLDRFSPGDGDGGRAVYLGALRPEKNLARLLRGARTAGVPLDVWGEGPDLPGLEAMAGPGTRFHGATDRPDDVLKGARLLALSSDTEQMPLTVLEAMATGLPVVSTDVGDVAAMLSAENRPYVVPLGDDDAYADALGALMNDPAAARRVGAANRREAEARFGLSGMLAAYGELMSRLAEGR